MAICTDGHPDIPSHEMPCQRRSEREVGPPPPAMHKGGDIHPPFFPRPFCSLELFRQPQPLQAFRDITLNLISCPVFGGADLDFISEQPNMFA